MLFHVSWNSMRRRRSFVGVDVRGAGPLKWGCEDVTGLPGPGER